MSINLSQILDWLGENAIVLSLFGLFLSIFNLVIIIFRFILEKPRLRYDIWRCYHYHNDKAGNSVIIIDMFIDNIGDRSTTIKGIKLLKINPEEYLKKAHSRSKEQQAHFRSTLRIRHYIDFPAFEIKDIEKIDIEFMIFHTHGKKTLKVTSIARELLDKELAEGRWWDSDQYIVRK